MSEREQVRAGLGVPSMVLVLVVLCLAMLGVLSLMSARSDAALVARQAELIQGYYEAASRAQEALSALDARMAEAWQASADDAQYAEACRRIESAGEAQVTWDEDTARIRMDAGSDRALSIAVKRRAFEEAGTARFTLVRHTLEDTLEWEQTDSLFLMGL